VYGNGWRTRSSGSRKGQGGRIRNLTSDLAKLGIKSIFTNAKNQESFGGIDRGDCSCVRRAAGGNGSDVRLYTLLELCGVYIIRGRELKDFRHSQEDQ
jgi:hypothetical protein